MSTPTDVSDTFVFTFSIVRPTGQWPVRVEGAIWARGPVVVVWIDPGPALVAWEDLVAIAQRMVIRMFGASLPVHCGEWFPCVLWCPHDEHFYSLTEPDAAPLSRACVHDLLRSDPPDPCVVVR